MRGGYALTTLARLELALYRSADLIVPVTNAFERYLRSHGVPGRKIAVVTNGVAAEEFAVAAAAPGWDPESRRPFRVGYLGTHGLAHGLDLALRAASAMGPAEVEFILVGDGADKPRLLTERARIGVKNVSFLDPVPRENVPDVLAGVDACLVPLRDSETFRSVIPSKIFEAAAARRPILLGVRGESESIVLGYGAGLSFQPDDEDALAAAIRRLRNEPGLYPSLQSGGERMALAYDRRVLARRMLTLLEGVLGGADA
jgi:hypothetical protein